MIKIINLCFLQYNYEKVDVTLPEEIEFYKKADEKKASYFLIYPIDCTDFEEDKEKVKTTLNNLESLYSTNKENNKSIKSILQNQFETQEASQIDKNTSAIYLLKFKDINNFDKHRNSVYAVEESPNYFKRYILPYTQQQVDDLTMSIANSNKPLKQTLSDIANESDEYLRLMKKENIESAYILTIRMFSKIPFLQYNFNASTAPQSIEKAIEIKIQEKKLMEFHNALKDHNLSIDKWLSLIDDIDEDIVNKEFVQLLGGNA